MSVRTVSLDALFKDLYPRAGERIKQWVVDVRREDAWERETCPRFTMDPHNDNTGAECRNVGRTLWTHLSHDCCETCCDAHERAADEPSVKAWLELRSKRPPICKDRSILSDEIAEDTTLREHPLLKAVRR